MTGFIMVYKLINGIFNSVHKFTVSTYTGINETIILGQIIKSKDKDILLRLDSSELTDPLKAGFPATTAWSASHIHICSCSPHTPHFLGLW